PGATRASMNFATVSHRYPDAVRVGNAVHVSRIRFVFGARRQRGAIRASPNYASVSHRYPEAVAVGDVEQVQRRAAGARSPRDAIRASQDRAVVSHRSPEAVAVGDAGQVFRRDDDGAAAQWHPLPVDVNITHLPLP